MNIHQNSPCGICGCCPCECADEDDDETKDSGVIESSNETCTI